MVRSRRSGRRRQLRRLVRSLHASSKVHLTNPLLADLEEEFERLSAPPPPLPPLDSDVEIVWEKLARSRQKPRIIEIRRVRYNIKIVELVTLE
jgi:transposase